MRGAFLQKSHSHTLKGASERASGRTGESRRQSQVASCVRSGPAQTQTPRQATHTHTHATAHLSPSNPPASFLSRLDGGRARRSDASGHSTSWLTATGCRCMATAAIVRLMICASSALRRRSHYLLWIFNFQVNGQGEARKRQRASGRARCLLVWMPAQFQIRSSICLRRPIITQAASPRPARDCCLADETEIAPARRRGRNLKHAMMLVVWAADRRG